MKMHIEGIISLINHIRYMLAVKFAPRLDKLTEQEKQSIQTLRRSVQSLGSNSPTATLSESIWRDNSKRLVHLIYRDDPRRFLRWDLITSTMFVGYRPYLIKELGYLKKLTDWESRWKNAIQESTSGLPIPYIHDRKTSGNLIHHAYHLAQFETASMVKASELDFVLEFGAGYGSMCRLFHNLGFRGQYVMFDLPIFSALQRYYLESLGIGVLAKQHGAPSLSLKPHYLSDLAELKLLLSGLKSGSPTLFIATWSLSEAPVVLRDSIVDQLSAFNNFLLAYQMEFEGTDNRDYFSRFVTEIDGHIAWKKWEIPHLPGNYYLIGTRR